MLFDNDLTVVSVLNYNGEEKTKMKLLPSEEAFTMGSSFENEYSQYKNYKPFMPKTTSLKNSLLYKIMELEFYINDLNLYLDLHPEDKVVFDKFKEKVKELTYLEKEYTSKYGPIVLNENTSEENKWIKDYPWEKEDSVYV